MLISHLLVRNFGRFENFSCDFSPGLNLIKGPNEAGKSTLAGAITAALFLDPSQGRKELASAARWGSADGPALEAIFDVGGRTFRLTKDFQRGVSELAGDETQVGRQSPDSVRSWLVDQTGMPSKEVFRATACIEQGEISHIENSIDAIKDKLESLVTGGKEDRAASMVIARLEKRIHQIAGEDGVSGGELARISKLSEELDYNIEKLTREIASLRAKRADLIQVEMAYKNVSEDLAGKRERLEHSFRANKQEDDFQRATTELQALELKLSEAQDSLKKIKDLRDRQAELKRIEPKDIKDLEALETNLKYLHPKKKEVEADARDADEEYKSCKIGGFHVGCAILGLSGAILTSLSYFLALLSFLHPYLLYGIVTSLAIFLIGLAFTLSRKQHRAYLKEQAEKLQSKLADIDREVQSETELMNGLLARHKAISLEDLKRNVWQFEDMDRQVVREKELYEGILAGRSMQELEQRHQDLQNKVSLIAKEKKQLSQYVIPDDELNRQDLVINQFEERLKDLDRGRTMLRQQIETAEGGVELLASYQERKEELKSRMRSLLYGITVVRLTVNCINEARQNVLVSTLEVLNARTSDILSKLTSGRYNRVRFDKSTFKFEVFSDERNDWLDPEKMLSAGTIDQIYLAARLALADLVSEEKNTVMILDDPFASYDEKRLENAMKVIKELSQNHQILLLTSQNHYDKWADTTISL